MILVLSAHPRKCGDAEVRPRLEKRESGTQACLAGQEKTADGLRHRPPKNEPPYFVAVASCSTLTVAVVVPV